MALVRDGACTLIGSGGMLWMLWRNSPDPTLVLVCAAFLGVPGVLGARRLASTDSGSGTPESGSQSPSHSSSPPSSPQLPQG